MKIRYGSLVSVGLAASLALGPMVQAEHLPNLFPFPNSTGFLETYNTAGGPIDLNGLFFQSLGTNGRSCASCHKPGEGWAISSDGVKLRFLLTQGLDPIFRTNDGSNCKDLVDTSTVAGRFKAYSLLINRGLIRVELSVPESAEFEVMSVQNPYGCNDTASVSIYRRPIPAANLRALTAVMWDGRESSPQTGTQKITYATNPADLLADLEHQALDATNGHAQGAVPLTQQQQEAIAQFEMSLVSAQAFDYQAGPLNSGGAKGGPMFLARQSLPNFYIGVNDPLGGNPLGTPFTPTIFNTFDAWVPNGGWQNERPASIARGQAVFNSKPIAITGVAGLNDDLNVTSIAGTCGTCHDSPNIGNHSMSVPLNIGVGDLISPLNVSYLPVFTLRNKTTGEIKTTTDPGRALISGAWKDVGKMKGPILHGLSSRAPYFHNGSAQRLGDVVNFYDKRFNIGFSAQEKADLIAFLSAL